MRSYTLNEETENSILDGLHEQLSDLFDEIGLEFCGIKGYGIKIAVLKCIVSFPIRDKSFEIELHIHWRNNAGIREVIIPRQLTVFAVNDLIKIANKLKRLDVLLDKRFVSELLEAVTAAMNKIENL